VVEDAARGVVVVKERFRKAYRHPELEARLSRSRLVQEERSIERARILGVKTPKVLATDECKGLIVMEMIPGSPWRQSILQNEQRPEQFDLARKAGEAIAKLHNGDLVHGDLTTSNIMVCPDGELRFIDFGLAKAAAGVEEKAVDMYVLERAFSSTHPGSESLFSHLLASYNSNLNPKSASKIQAKFQRVQQRGRKRLQMG